MKNEYVQQIKNSKKKYIAFWRTKQEITPESRKDIIPIMATLLKMVETNENVILWGRCEGELVKMRYHFNGFAIIHNVADIEDVIKIFRRYVDFKSIHTYTDTEESRELLKYLQSCE